MPAKHKNRRSSRPTHRQPSRSAAAAATRRDLAHFSESPPAGAVVALDRLTQAAIQWQQEAVDIARSSGPFLTPYQALNLWAKAWGVWASALEKR